MSTESGDTGNASGAHRADSDDGPLDTSTPVTAPVRDPGQGNRNSPDSGYSGIMLEPVLANRAALLDKEQERFGGVKIGAAFFGWLTAVGMLILLSVLTSVISAAAKVPERTDLARALEYPATNQSAGLVGGIIMLAVLMLSYFAGGYVAGRMARFHGLVQGFAVWVWAFGVSAVVIFLSLELDSSYRSIWQLNTVLLLPEEMDGYMRGSWLAVPAVLAATLSGACLGGLAGMRYHRRVDRAEYYFPERAGR